MASPDAGPSPGGGRLGGTAVRHERRSGRPPPCRAPSEGACHAPHSPGAGLRRIGRPRQNPPRRGFLGGAGRHDSRLHLPCRRHLNPALLARRCPNRLVHRGQRPCRRKSSGTAAGGSGGLGSRTGIQHGGQVDRLLGGAGPNRQERGPVLRKSGQLLGFRPPGVPVFCVGPGAPIVFLRGKAGGVGLGLVGVHRVHRRGSSGAGRTGRLGDSGKASALATLSRHRFVTPRGRGPAGHPGGGFTLAGERQMVFAGPLAFRVHSPPRELPSTASSAHGGGPGGPGYNRGWPGDGPPVDGLPPSAFGDRVRSLDCRSGMVGEHVLVQTAPLGLRRRPGSPGATLSGVRGDTGSRCHSGSGRRRLLGSAAGTRAPATDLPGDHVGHRINSSGRCLPRDPSHPEGGRKPVCPVPAANHRRAESEGLSAVFDRPRDEDPGICWPVWNVY